MNINTILCVCEENGIVVGIQDNGYFPFIFKHSDEQNRA